MIKEIFIPVIGFELSYKISNYGNLLSLPKEWKSGKNNTSSHNGLIVKPGVGRYACVCLYKDSTITRTSIHRLVAIHFIPNPENKPCVNHKDGNKLNNVVDNLEWVTLSENMQHALKNKLKVPIGGENCNFSKLKRNQVDDIRKMYSTGNYTQHKLAAIYKVRQSAIHKIVTNKTWA